MLITSMQWAPDIHYGMTTVNDNMNVGRAINAGEVTFYTDATFGICKNEVSLVGVWVGKRCDGTVIVRCKRDSVLTRNLGGVKVAGNRNDEVKKLRKVCADRRFDLALKRQNSREEHIQPHQM